jgi:predicted Zn-dependent protease
MTQWRWTRLLARQARAFGVASLIPLQACATGHTTAVATTTPHQAVTASAFHGTLARGVPFSSPELGFELDKPAGKSWAIATNVTSPEGRPIPVVVAHPQSGAQIVIQVSDPVDSPKSLTSMLRQKLQAEKSLTLGAPQKIKNDSGSEAYGFDFAVKGEAKGRVAVISIGQQIILVVASWPENANPQVIDDIDSVVRSVRTPSGTTRASLNPDKA